jgi:hypothetical protein
MNNGRTTRVLLGLYPRSWRERYGAELADLIADARAAGANRIRIGADVLRGAGVERLRAAEFTGDGPAHSRARGGSVLVLWAWALFLPAGATLQKLAEHWSAGLPAGQRAVPGVAFEVLVAAAVVAALLVAAGLALAAPRLPAGFHAGLWQRVRRRVALAVALSVAALIGTAGLVDRARDLSAAQRNGQDLAYSVAFLTWAGLVLATLLAWTAVASAAARGVDLPHRVLRAQSTLCVGVTTAMVVTTVAAFTWSFALSRTGPTVVAAAMAVATALAAAGSHRAGTAVRDLAR